MIACSPSQVDLTTPGRVRLVPTSGSRGEAATVATPNLPFCNAIVHVVDTVSFSVLGEY